MKVFIICLLQSITLGLIFMCSFWQAQTNISEDHEHNISFSQINLSEARENFFKNTKAHQAQKDISEALEQFQRKELRWRDVSTAYLASLANIWGLYFI